MRLVGGKLISRVASDHRDAATLRCRFVVGRPVDRAALQKADAQPAAIGDCRGASRGKIGAGAGVADAEAVEPRKRAEDGRSALIHIVGEPDPGNPGALQCLAGDLRVGKKSLVLDGVPVGRLV